MSIIRAFIAIELSPKVLNQIGGLQEKLKRDVPSGLVRWVRPEGIHLTLKFLGDTPVEQVHAVAQAVHGACDRHAPFALAVRGTGCFPNPHRPRVIWAGVHEPTGVLARLQRDVERMVQPLGFPPEGRPFHPHLTLGRVKGRDQGAIQTLGETVCRAALDGGQMGVDAVHLIRSELLPGGAVYTRLSRAPLAAKTTDADER